MILKAIRKQRSIMMRTRIWLAASLFAQLLIGCVPSPDEENKSTVIELPSGSRLELFCDNVGINDNVCVLDDPENPYAMVDVNGDNKWDLISKIDSNLHKARFYLWATALARNPSGENQYYTADSLNKLYTINGDEAVKLQAQKAYRSVLDNFFDSVTWFLDEWSTEPDIYYVQPLADLVGSDLYNPGDTLSLLYADQVKVLGAISSWGYYYDTTNNIMTKIE